MSLSGRLRNARRLREIVTVLVEEGFLDYLGRLASHAPLKSRIGAQQRRVDPVRVRETLERLGPTFIKLGQLLSIRPDLIPAEFCEELRKLQDDVPPVPFAVIRGVLQAELAKSLNTFFSEVEERPLAAASLSQVHKALLKNGAPVALKVQRPGTRTTMERDIELMEFMARHLSRRLPGFRANEIVREFKSYTRKELDFRIEAQSMARFHRAFADQVDFVVPKVYEKYSTANLLVMEYFSGAKLNDRAALKRRGHDLKELARTGFRSVFHQVFEVGLFHGDPHPGNLLVRRVNGREQLILLDYGIVGILDHELRDDLVRFFIGMVEGDVQAVSDVMLTMSDRTPESDVRGLKRSIAALLLEWRGTTLEQERLSTLFHRILNECLAHGVQPRTDIVLVAKAFITMEGVALWLDPTFNVTEEAMPLIARLQGSQFTRLGPGVRELRRFYDTIRKLPEGASKALERIGEGGFSVSLDKTILHKAAVDLDLEMAKRNLALTSSAFFVGSALLAGLAPDLAWFGIPLYQLGFLGFLATLLLLIAASVRMHRYLEREM